MKSLRITITFVLLLGGYFGYTRLFAVVADQLRQDLRPKVRGDFDPSPGQSASAREASALASEGFGKDHWTAYSDKRYYNVEQGYWIHFNSYERNPEFEGKRIEFSPFALLTRKQDGSLMVISGDKAVVDFDKPFNLIKPGPSPSIVHARIEGINRPVEIRDNRGTTDPADDLVVTMPYVEYIESSLQIRCSQAVHLVDRDVDVTGIGLLISLRPGDSGPGGFSGADSITLERDVEIRAADVGQTGLLPGAARPEQQVPGVEAPKTPVRLKCDGPMRLHFPMPRVPVWVGPPAPERPTIADFSRNVVVQRGAGIPDQINGDHLRAILVPNEAEPAISPDPENLELEAAPALPLLADGESAPATAPPTSSGPLQSLVLQEARVDGHAVWLQSEAQGVKVRSNELIYKKAKDNEPDITYLRADAGKQLWLERVELDDRGKLKSVMTIWTTDATIQGGPEDGEGTTVVARGPGLMEMRAARDRPVDRSATWKDELIVHTGVPDQAATPSGDEPVETLTYVTLTGWPVIDDPEQVVMSARDRIIACLEDRPKPPPGQRPAASSGSDSSADAYQLRWLKAVGDVHMVTPESTSATASQPHQSLNGREQLNVVFEYPTLETEEAPASELAASRPVVAPAVSSEANSDRDSSAQTRLATQAERDPQGEESTETPAPPKPAEPGVEVEADVIWARVEAVPNTNGGSPRREVREVRLRGDVVFHQDPKPGDDQGLDILATSLDLTSPGPDRAWFQAYGEEDDWASVATPEFTIEGPVLGLDQSRDFAWVRGPGRLTQTSEGVTLTGLGRPATDSDSDSESQKSKAPLVIDWAGGMLFHGIYPDERGRPGPARALFVAGVKAKLGDDRVDCEEMEAIMDRPISFARGGGSIGFGGDDRGGRPQPKVAAVICRENVKLLSVDRDEQTGAIREQRRVVGNSVTFEKESGNYWVDDIGAILLTTREAQTEPPAGPNNGQPRQATPSKLYQTRIDFRKGMEGHLGDASAGASRGVREATFQGDVQVLRAEVGRFGQVLVHDNPPADALSMGANTLYVESNPAIPASNVPARDLMKATGNAEAQSDGKSLQADWITYDSLTGLFYAGTNSSRTKVTIASQDAPGQEISTSSSQAVQYNPKNRGEAKMIGPGTMQLFQPGTGYRLGAHSPPAPVVEEPERRPEPRLPPGGNLERQGFTGN